MHGDVPGHRGVRAADHARRSGSATPTTGARHAPGAPAAGAAGRPGAAADQPACSRSSRALLDLADARLTAPEVLDLAAQPRRCGAGSASTTTTWSGSATGSRRPGSAGGWTRPTGRRTSLDGVPQNTWAAGLDRVLLGVAMDEEDLRIVGPRCRSTTSTATTSTSPGGSPSSSTGWRGRRARCAATQSLTAGWTPLATAVDDLTATARRRRLAAGAGATRARRRRRRGRRRRRRGAARLADVRALLADRLRGRPTRAELPHRPR